uniref:(California timema) hypothetical protein n=1 Tax=Timema californicum TaxID=61474 RepID=A0A7R9P407_TIMCA|nr:unnamed protein product [Timema californicum]
MPQFMKNIQKPLYGTVRFTVPAYVVFDCCAQAHIGGGWEGRWDCQLERALLLSQFRLWHNVHLKRSPRPYVCECVCDRDACSYPHAGGVSFTVYVVKPSAREGFSELRRHRYLNHGEDDNHG